MTPLSAMGPAAAAAALPFFLAPPVACFCFWAFERRTVSGRVSAFQTVVPFRRRSVESASR
jgi:hypothetical protein